MITKIYESPQAAIYEVVPEAGIAESYGKEGSAGGILEVDDTDLKW